MNIGAGVIGHTKLRPKSISFLFDITTGPVWWTDDVVVCRCRVQYIRSVFKMTEGSPSPETQVEGPDKVSRSLYFVLCRIFDMTWVLTRYGLSTALKYTLSPVLVTAQNMWRNFRIHQQQVPGLRYA